MKTIVLGVGNPILRDDGVGIHVIQCIFYVRYSMVLIEHVRDVVGSFYKYTLPASLINQKVIKRRSL